MVPEPSSLEFLRPLRIFIIWWFCATSFRVGVCARADTLTHTPLSRPRPPTPRPPAPLAPPPPPLGP